MGFVVKKNEEDDLGGLLGTGQKQEKRGSEARGHNGLTMDLDVLVCENCRSELLPWHEQCPDDGGKGVRLEDLPAQNDDVLNRFLEREQSGDLPD